MTKPITIDIQAQTSGESDIKRFASSVEMGLAAVERQVEQSFAPFASGVSIRAPV